MKTLTPKQLLNIQRKAAQWHAKNGFMPKSYSENYLAGYFQK